MRQFIIRECDKKSRVLVVDRLPRHKHFVEKANTDTRHVL